MNKGKLGKRDNKKRSHVNNEETTQNERSSKRQNYNMMDAVK